MEIKVEYLQDSIEFDDIEDIESPGRPPVFQVENAIHRSQNQPQQYQLSVSLDTRQAFENISQI